MSRLVVPPRDFSLMIAGQVGASDLTDQELRYALIVYKKLIEALMAATVPAVAVAVVDAEITIQPSAIREGRN